jgi:murein DD-endopeptidase MepM/ murein hydrolase activator NlpD
MIEAEETTDEVLCCASCGGSLRAQQFFAVTPSGLESFCSMVCLDTAAGEQRRELWATRRRRLKNLVIALTLGSAIITPHQMPLGPRAAKPPKPTASASGPQPFGPSWPPTEGSLLEELGRDAWIHPLAGPFRRMPLSDGRVFGAERPGERPAECRNGHCGVDLGGEIWGEQVRAAHDGVVDRVVRGPNDDHGGLYVRIAHRGGTVYSQYFHLAAIPHALAVGMKVKRGDVIGLLGDSGVKESTAHLHFTISVRRESDGLEQYVDPEPLIALWPLHVPVGAGGVAVVTTSGPPGVPLGSAVGHRKRHHAKTAPPRIPTLRIAPPSDEEDARPAPHVDDEPAGGE